MVVVFGLIIMFELIKTEDNGQWIEVCGIPYFCPDNSSYYDFDLDEDEEHKPELNTDFELESQAEIEFDEF
ncbi:hypothetical protein [Planktothrix sp.]|jgi:hypothetical protein|uniref:hypothetical protein n=2 Tax=Planktothrix sp. TaxID=3088171 RepID=UPI0038D38D36